MHSEGVKIAGIDKFPRREGRCEVTERTTDDQHGWIHEGQDWCMRTKGHDGPCDACYIPQAVRAQLAEARQRDARAREALKRARAALNSDRTGLAAGLAAVVERVNQGWWITEGRGSYAWDDDRYRMETCMAFEAMRGTARKALNESGALADVEVRACDDVLAESPAPAAESRAKSSLDSLIKSLPPVPDVPLDEKSLALLLDRSELAEPTNAETVRAAGQACVDWARDTGACHLCAYQAGAKSHDEECPLRRLEEPSEHPNAEPKNVEDVMAAQADLVEIVHELHGVVCVKG